MRFAGIALALAFSLGHATTADAQTLRDHFNRLYTFGDCGQPLCLPVNAEVHGHHFIPSVTQGQNNMLAFVDGAIATSLSNIPVTAAASGVRITWQGGVPVPVTLSPGPFFAERSYTLGAGRALIGANVTGISFDNVRGVNLDDLRLRFAHQNVADPAMGDPVFENDVIEVAANLDLSLLVTSFYAAFGLANRADVQVVVPFIRASLSGSSTATVQAYDPPSPHAFGTPGSPSNVASASTSATATGLGDIAVRAKLNVYETDQVGVAAVTDLRLPTGDPDDFLGTGATAVRALGVVSGQYGTFSPHVNAGVAFRSAANQTHSFLAAVGFDQLLSDYAAFSVELLSDLQLGESKLLLPNPVVYTAPELRTLHLSDIPEQADNLVDVAVGTKLQLPGAGRAMANVLIPISEGGMRPRMLWTFGIQRNF